MEQTQRENPTDYQLASAIARYVELDDVHLIDVKASLLVAKAEMLQLSVLELELGRSMACSMQKDTQVISVEAKLKADIHNQNDGRAKPLLSINCTYVLNYKFMAKGAPEGAELQRYLDAFARVNGVFNIWPYFRELIQSLSARMSLPPIVVPVYRVSKEQEAPSSVTEPSKGTTKAKVGGQSNDGDLRAPTRAKSKNRR